MKRLSLTHSEIPNYLGHVVLRNQYGLRYLSGRRYRQIHRKDNPYQLEPVYTGLNALHKALNVALTSMPDLNYPERYGDPTFAIDEIDRLETIAKLINNAIDTWEAERLANGYSEEDMERDRLAYRATYETPEKTEREMALRKELGIDL